MGGVRILGILCVADGDQALLGLVTFKKDSGWVHAGHAMKVCPRILSCHTIAVFSMSNSKHNPANSCVKHHVYLAARC